MHSYYTFIALDLANQRVREADRERLAAMVVENREGSARRYVAIGLAAVGRLVAAAVRRLDECVADDLAESLRPESLAATR
jgi:hypothetical protein